MAADLIAIRNTLEGLVPFRREDGREAWFHRAARVTGLRRSRLKSLFYNPRCRLWAIEADVLARAMAARDHARHETRNAAADLQRRVGILTQKQETIAHDLTHRAPPPHGLLFSGRQPHGDAGSGSL